MARHRQIYLAYPDGMIGTYSGAGMIKDALALPSPQREEVLAELRRMYGNTYMAQAMAGKIPGDLESQRKTGDSPDVSTLLSRAYWDKYGPKMFPAAIQRASAEAAIQLNGPGLTLRSSSAFVDAALREHAKESSFHTVAELLACDLDAVIDGGRLVDAQGFGPDQWEPMIVDRLVDRVLHEMYRAVARLAIPYAKARAAAVAAAQADAGASGAPTLMTFLVDPGTTEPNADDLGAMRPIETAVATALCSGIVGFDPVAFDAHPEAHIPGAEPAGAPQAIELQLERGRGDWMTVTVVTPISVTTRDVANELYGTPNLAHLVVGAGERYAFGFPPGRRLAEPYDSDWAGFLAADGYPKATEIILRGSSDPFMALDDQTADADALESVQGHPASGEGQAAVVQRLAIMEDLVGQILALGDPLGVNGLIGPVLARLQARRVSCTADPAEAERWAVQSTEQVGVLTEARDGLTSLTNQLLGSGMAGVSTANGEELVGDVQAQMSIPSRQVAQAWARAVAASENATVAQERLALAKERLQQYPFELVERALAIVQTRIDRIGRAGDTFVQTIEPARIAAIQTDLRASVSRLRVAVTNGDGTALLQLQALRPKIALLDLHSTVGATMGAISMVGEELRTSVSGAPDRDEQAGIAAQINGELSLWYPLLEQYDALWRSGTETEQANIDKLKADLAARSSRTKLPGLISRTAAFAENEAKKERFIRIYNIIVFAIAAAATGGLASAAFGGGLVGGIAGAGVEALTFTGLSQTMKSDPSWGGFFAELGINFATFGGLRAIGGGAKILAAGELTMSQKAMEITAEGLWMTASAKASEEIHRLMEGGKKISSEDAGHIFAESLLMAFATRVASRVGGTLFEKFKGLPEADQAMALRSKTGQLADQVLTGKNPKVGDQLAEADTASLKADAKALDKLEHLAENPAAAKTALGKEIDAATAKEIAAESQATQWQILDKEIGALTQRTQAFGDHLLAEPEVYQGLIDKHRRLGSEIAEGFDAAGSKRAVIRPKGPDGSFGPQVTIHVKGKAPKFEWAQGLTDSEIGQVLQQLGEPLSSSVSAGEGAFTGTELVEVADLVGRLRKTANVRGVDDWIAFEEAHGADHLRRAMAELRAVERRAAQNTGQVFEIGQDAHAPSRPGTINERNPKGDPMQSFDISVREGDTVAKSIEVTSAGEPVKRSSDLTEGVRHASNKAAGRIRDKAPIPGKELEVEIRIDLFKGEQTIGTGKITYDGAGGYSYKVQNGQFTPPKFGGRTNPGNIFADFAQDLGKIGHNDLLHVVTLVNESGAVVATFRREGTAWTWEPTK